MQTYESLKHTTWECKYHVVFIPKCRRKVLYQGIRQELGTVFRSLAEQWECKVEEGRSAARSRAHAVERAAEVFGVQRDGVYQREERDPYCAGVCRTAKELRRPAFLGAWLLGVNGRQERGCRASVYPRPGKGRQTPRTTGTGGALSASRS